MSNSDPNKDELWSGCIYDSGSVPCGETENISPVLSKNMLHLIKTPLSEDETECVH